MRMNSVRASAPQLAGLTPYDPKYLPADTLLSANENPSDVEEELRREIMREVRRVPLNRYPDPLANDLRDMIAEANGLDRNQVLVGNGGDELLFNIALAWGGPGRKFLNLPPTFSVYAANARLTGTETVDVPRRADFSIDEEAVLARVAEGDIDYLIVTSPNNPTGDLASSEFVARLLEATDALVMVDEAYFETLAPHRPPAARQAQEPRHPAHVLQGVLAGGRARGVSARRCGRDQGVHQGPPAPFGGCGVAGDRARGVRQPREVRAGHPGDHRRAGARARRALARIPGVTAHPSDANYLMFRIKDAGEVWENLYERGVLVRDFSRTAHLEDCLRVTIGTREENDAFLAALKEVAIARM